jgi:ribonuclease D
MYKTKPMAVTAREKTPETYRSSPPVLVDLPESFDLMLGQLVHEPLLGLDTESDSLYRYFHRVCLIQVSTRLADYVVDPLRLPNLEPLGALLANPGVEKVFHAAENDILVLKRDLGFEFAHVFDTMIAARILGYRRVGLAALLREKFDVELDKRTQLTDWGHRPLSAEQLNYACLDSHYLLSLRDLLKEELVARGRWREAQEAFSNLPDTPYVAKSFDPDGFWRYREARDLSPTELAVLRELYVWRDGQARAMNRPPFKVASDECLARLSREQPSRLADLHLGRWQVQHFGGAILAAVERGKVAPAPQPPNRNSNREHRLDPATVQRYDRLRAWRGQRAAERGVEADVVLTNEALLTIARAAPSSLSVLNGLGVMGPWKLEEYGPDVLRLLTATG